MRSELLDLAEPGGGSPCLVRGLAACSRRNTRGYLEPFLRRFPKPAVYAEGWWWASGAA